MHPRCRALSLAFGLLFCATAVRAQTPTISVNVRLVNVFVNVTDSQGAPVAGLTREDFLLSEDNHPQKIAVFERQSELPLEIVLAIDTSGSVHKDFTLEHEAARHFVHSLLRPVDHLDLMEFSDNVREVVFFTNNPGRVDRGLNDMGRGAATALYAGVYLASQSLAPRSGRKVLVIISDGGNTVKGTTYDQALEQAQRGEVMVYPIIDVPIAASAGRDLEGEHALITLAQETGGKYYYADSSSLDKTFAQLSEDLRTQYLVGYYPTNRVGSWFSHHLGEAAWGMRRSLVLWCVIAPATIPRRCRSCKVFASSPFFKLSFVAAPNPGLRSETWATRLSKLVFCQLRQDSFIPPPGPVRLKVSCVGKSLFSLPALTPGRVPHVRPRRTWAEYEYFFECFQLIGRERSMGLRPVLFGPRTPGANMGHPSRGEGW